LLAVARGLLIGGKGRGGGRVDDLAGTAVAGVGHTGTVGAAVLGGYAPHALTHAVALAGWSTWGTDALGGEGRRTGHAGIRRTIVGVVGHVAIVGRLNYLTGAIAYGDLAVTETLRLDGRSGGGERRDALPVGALPLVTFAVGRQVGAVARTDALDAGATVIAEPPVIAALAFAQRGVLGIAIVALVERTGVAVVWDVVGIHTRLGGAVAVADLSAAVAVDLGRRREPDGLGFNPAPVVYADDALARALGRRTVLWTVADAGHGLASPDALAAVHTAQCGEVAYVARCAGHGPWLAGTVSQDVLRVGALTG